MRRATLFFAATVGALGILGSSRAQAYTAGKTCNGVVNWTYAPNIDVDSCTIPSGSAPWTAFNYNVSRWSSIYNNHIGSVFSINHSCSLTYGDGINEVMLVSQSTLGSNLDALTTCEYSTCVFSHGTYTECDIIALNTLSYSPQDESFWDWSSSQEGRVALSHELGHFIGLGHSQGFDIMRAVSPWPLAGGTNAEPYADDAAGARWLYPTPLTNRTNVFASSEMLFNNQIESTDGMVPISAVNVCRGQAISVTYSVVNNGNVDVNSVGFRIFVTNDIVGLTNQTNIYTATATSPAQSYFTATQTLTVPNVTTNGTYWILWEIDSGHAVSETNEDDNIVHSGLVLNVNC